MAASFSRWRPSVRSERIVARWRASASRTSSNSRRPVLTVAASSEPAPVARMRRIAGCAYCVRHTRADSAAAANSFATVRNSESPISRRSRRVARISCLRPMWNGRRKASSPASA